MIFTPGRNKMSLFVYTSIARVAPGRNSLNLLDLCWNINNCDGSILLSLSGSFTVTQVTHTHTHTHTHTPYALASWKVEHNIPYWLCFSCRPGLEASLPPTWNFVSEADVVVRKAAAAPVIDIPNPSPREVGSAGPLSDSLVSGFEEGSGEFGALSYPGLPPSGAQNEHCATKSTRLQRDAWADLCHLVCACCLIYSVPCSGSSSGPEQDGKKGKKEEEKLGLRRTGCLWCSEACWCGPPVPRSSTSFKWLSMLLGCILH